MSLIDDIQRAQIRAGEDAVMRNLERMGLAAGSACCDGDSTHDYRERMTAATQAAERMVSAQLEAAGDILVKHCHGTSMQAGWWHDLKTGQYFVEEIAAGTRLGKSLVAEKLCLVHSEISEAMEGHRKGLPDDKLPHRPMLEVELADAMIRICDLAGAMGLDLGGAIAEKLAFNAQRLDHKPEARAAYGGKAY